MSSKSPLRTVRLAFVHPAAIVETDGIGEGSRIWAFTHVMEGASIGANCNIGEHCFVEGGAVVGDNVTIKNGNMLWEGITIENGVFVGPAVVFTNDRYPRSARAPHGEGRYRGNGWLLPTLVQQGATLGAGSIILPGITLGEFCMIAAGAVVTRNVPSYALIVGNPGQVRGWVCQCGQPLAVEDATTRCGSCDKAYQVIREAGDVTGLSPQDENRFGRNEPRRNTTEGKAS